MRRPPHSVSRRDFVSSALTALAATGPVSAMLGMSACTTGAPTASPLWGPPALLEALGAERVLRIGRAWMRMHADERSAHELLAAITRHDGAEDQPSATAIAAQVVRDFEQNRIVVVDGWILGVTEARQCALYVISHG